MGLLFILMSLNGGIGRVRSGGDGSLLCHEWSIEDGGGLSRKCAEPNASGRASEGLKSREFRTFYDSGSSASAGIARLRRISRSAP
jgi:hypothetical protein